MTTYFDFVPGRFAPFTFQPTLDGNPYNATVKWNLQAQRWYIYLDDQTGNNIFTLPLIGSLNPIPINSIEFNNGIVSVGFINQLFYPLGSLVNITYTENTPDGYNGLYLSTVTGLSSMEFFLQNNPGSIITFGYASYNINLAGGYFNSTLIFRDQSQRFEVTP